MRERVSVLEESARTPYMGVRTIAPVLLAQLAEHDLAVKVPGPGTVTFDEIQLDAREAHENRFICSCPKFLLNMLNIHNQSRLCIIFS